MSLSYGLQQLIEKAYCRGYNKGYQYYLSKLKLPSVTESFKKIETEALFNNGKKSIGLMALYDVPEGKRRARTVIAALPPVWYSYAGNPKVTGFEKIGNTIYANELYFRITAQQQKQFAMFSDIMIKIFTKDQDTALLSNVNKYVSVQPDKLLNNLEQYYIGNNSNLLNVDDSLKMIIDVIDKKSNLSKELSKFFGRDFKNEVLGKHSEKKSTPIKSEQLQKKIAILKRTDFRPILNKIYLALFADDSYTKEQKSLYIPTGFVYYDSNNQYFIADDGYDSVHEIKSGDYYQLYCGGDYIESKENVVGTFKDIDGTDKTEYMKTNKLAVAKSTDQTWLDYQIVQFVANICQTILKYKDGNYMKYLNDIYNIYIKTCNTFDSDMMSSIADPNIDISTIISRDAYEDVLGDISDYSKAMSIQPNAIATKDTDGSLIYFIKSTGSDVRKGNNTFLLFMCILGKLGLLEAFSNLKKSVKDIKDHNPSLKLNFKQCKDFTDLLLLLSRMDCHKPTEFPELSDTKSITDNVEQSSNGVTTNNAIATSNDNVDDLVTSSDEYVNYDNDFVQDRSSESFCEYYIKAIGSSILTAFCTDGKIEKSIEKHFSDREDKTFVAMQVILSYHRSMLKIFRELLGYSKEPRHKLSSDTLSYDEVLAILIHSLLHQATLKTVLDELNVIRNSKFSDVVAQQSLQDMPTITHLYIKKVLSDSSSYSKTKENGTSIDTAIKNIIRNNPLDQLAIKLSIPFLEVMSSYVKQEYYDHDNNLKQLDDYNVSNDSLIKALAGNEKCKLNIRVKISGKRFRLAGDLSVIKRNVHSKVIIHYPSYEYFYNDVKNFEKYTYGNNFEHVDSIYKKIISNYRKAINRFNKDSAEVAYPDKVTYYIKNGKKQQLLTVPDVNLHHRDTFGGYFALTKVKPEETAIIFDIDSKGVAGKYLDISIENYVSKYKQHYDGDSYYREYSKNEDDPSLPELTPYHYLRWIVISKYVSFTSEQRMRFLELLDKLCNAYGEAIKNV